MKIPILFIWATVFLGTATSQDLFVSKRFSTKPNSQDTSVTVIQYDSNGFKVHEISNGITVSDWDAKGRYLGTRDLSGAEYFDSTVWITEDSTLRNIPGFDSPVGDKYFGLKPNCWCADSIFHYRENKTLIQKRKFEFDSNGNIQTVFLVWMLQNPSVLDTGRIIHNSYDQNSRLISSIEIDRETGSDTTFNWFQYDELKNLIVERKPTSVIRRISKTQINRSIYTFDLLGRYFGHSRKQIRPLQ